MQAAQVMETELQRNMVATSALAGTCWTLLMRQVGLIWRMPGKRSRLALGMGLETPASPHHRTQLPPTRATAPEHGPVRCAILWYAVQQVGGCIPRPHRSVTQLYFQLQHTGCPRLHFHKPGYSSKDESF